MSIWLVSGITQTGIDGSQSVSVTVPNVPYAAADEAAPADNDYAGLYGRSLAIETHVYAVGADRLPEAAKLALPVFLEERSWPHVRHVWTTVVKPGQCAGRERS